MTSQKGKGPSAATLKAPTSPLEVRQAEHTPKREKLQLRFNGSKSPAEQAQFQLDALIGRHDALLIAVGNDDKFSEAYQAAFYELMSYRPQNAEEFARKCAIAFEGGLEAGLPCDEAMEHIMADAIRLGGRQPSKAPDAIA